MKMMNLDVSPLTDPQQRTENQNFIQIMEWARQVRDVIGKGTKGDLLYYNGTEWVKLPIGTAGQVLTVSAAGLPSWM